MITLILIKLIVNEVAMCGYYIHICIVKTIAHEVLL